MANPAALLGRHRLADREGWRHRRFAAGVRELHAELAVALRLAEGHDARQRFLGFVVVETETPRRDAAFRLDAAGLGDDEPDVGAGILAEMHDVPVGRLAVFGGVLAHRRQHDAIFERQAAHDVGREKQRRHRSSRMALTIVTFF
jgi:hypothetical protein